MLTIKSIKFIKSIINIKNRPEPLLPEFAFAGRSNVGKSSLINCLLNRSSLAKVSKSPGKTRTINYFLINDAFYLVDLPGYGYARVPPAEQIRWQGMIEGYLIKNPYLCTLFVLVDSLVGPKKNDIQLFEWLHFQAISYQLILTKADRIGRQKQHQRVSEMQNLLHIETSRAAILFSSKNRIGRIELLKSIESCLSAFKSF